MNDQLIWNLLLGNRWKRFFALTMVWMATSLVASAQTVTIVYSFDLTNGALPKFVSPTQGRDGAIYGTASVGGTGDACGRCGTAFRFTPQGVVTSASFNGTNGATPEAGLVLGPNGLLYGTTDSGGTSENGGVFSLDPKTMALTVLHDFIGSDGAQPEAPLALGPGGKYYGTTFTGGAKNLGTVFSITPAGTFASLYSFGGSDGQNPVGAGLTVGPDGALYGMGSFDTIFRISASGAFRKFAESGGSFGSLLLASDGNMYGTTNSQDVSGTVFKLTRGGIVTDLYNFTLGAPEAGLVQGTDGKLYGTTFAGGACGYGEIFSITTDGTYTKLYDFPCPDYAHGAHPYGLMQNTDGKFYGVTNQGGTSHNCDPALAVGCGTVFSLDVGLRPFVKFVVAQGKVGYVAQILGTGLTGSTVVKFNGVRAPSFKVISNTFMTATVPVGAITGPVTVTTPSGTLTSNVKFTVLP